LYIDGMLVGLGPGRGESPVWRSEKDPRTFKSLPYNTLDVTSSFAQRGVQGSRAGGGRSAVIAIEALHHGDPTGPMPILQINLVTSSPASPSAAETTTTTTVITTDGSWRAFNGDLHRKPGPSKHGNSAGTAPGIEFIDARGEPVGWKTAPDSALSGGGWAPAVASEPSPGQLANLHAKMEPPMQFFAEVPAAGGVAARNRTRFVADFGRELQGGLRLAVADGTAGTVVHIACGESLSADGETVGDTWAWEFEWVLRDGEQLLEQHKYMEFRWCSLQFRAGNASAAPHSDSESPPSAAAAAAAEADWAVVPANWTVSAWRAQYPYDPRDSHFESDNATLDAVFELCRYTLEAGVLDTYSDSNTRERQPYEADGIVAASARYLLQRDFLWARHSHAWVINDPTWPVEWRQLSPFLGWQVRWRLHCWPWTGFALCVGVALCDQRPASAGRTIWPPGRQTSRRLSRSRCTTGP
jgi:hypothetical protein